MPGVYASCTYTESSLEALAEWLEDHIDIIPVPVTSNKIHTTIVYSHKRFEVSDEHIDQLNSKIGDFEFKPKGITLLGDENSKALVLLLDADPLISIHEKLLEHGASHGFDEYIPHVTIAYEVPENFDVSPIKIPNFTLQPDKIKFEPLITKFSVQKQELVI